MALTTDPHARRRVPGRPAHEVRRLRATVSHGLFRSTPERRCPSPVNCPDHWLRGVGPDGPVRVLTIAPARV